MNTTTAQNTSNEIIYFDLHTKGLGYLNRVRSVPVKRGEPYLACTIAALRGNSQDKLYTKFDVVVSGAEAKNVIDMFAADINAVNDMGETLNRVLCGFTIGDIYPETFTYQTGTSAGKLGTINKGRLLKLSWVKVNGETRYTAPKAAEPATDSQESADGLTGTNS